MPNFKSNVIRDQNIRKQKKLFKLTGDLKPAAWNSFFFHFVSTYFMKNRSRFFVINLFILWSLFWKIFLAHDDASVYQSSCMVNKSLMKQHARLNLLGCIFEFAEGKSLLFLSISCGFLNYAKIIKRSSQIAKHFRLCMWCEMNVAWN